MLSSLALMIRVRVYYTLTKLLESSGHGVLTLNEAIYRSSGFHVLIQQNETIVINSAGRLTDIYLLFWLSFLV